MGGGVDIVIAIIDYEAGNLRSVELALKHIGADCIVTQDPEVIKSADKVIFPGVGAAESCMENLKRFRMDKALVDALESNKKVLAICVGMQLLFEKSMEDGGVDCLGVLKGTVEHFEFPNEERVKIPHMGWNEVDFVTPHPVFKNIPPSSEYYFVHSYYVEGNDIEILAGKTEYAGKVFTSAIARDNLAATQFHPEKSGKVGLQILKNFLDW